jgi:vacuolar-type H+-ATPase subunit B/Vma2
LATICKRAGHLKGIPEPTTHLAILIMPNDGITHPAADPASYTHEGQIYLARALITRQIFRQIKVGLSLSRPMKTAIDYGRKRKDHADVSSQFYVFYAAG